MKWQLCRLEWSKWVRVRRVLVFSFLAALLVASPIQALNASREDEWSTYDIFWFDPDEDLSLVPADRSNCGLSGDIMVSGTDATGKIWSALISGGLTPEQAAGVMGNIQVESGFGPTRHENSFINSDYNIEEKYTYVNSNGKTVEVSYGIGLVQWSAGRRRNLLANMPADQKALLLDSKI